jgi:hypothetical protein
MYLLQRTCSTCRIEQPLHIFALILINYLLYGCLDGAGIEQSIVLAGAKVEVMEQQ